MSVLEQFDFWRFLAGLGVFLLGMSFIEIALKNLANRSFKKFLRLYTTRPINGILGGTFITAFLQSSSVVTLMVLAFVGAGILQLKNAIGIIFGSNLGTTFTGWIVALFGFKLDVEAFSLPFVALGGILYLLFARREKLNELGRVILGFGFLFLGLQFMKVSIEELATHFDIGIFSGLNPYLFFPIGLVLTAIIQSSSATMVIALTALNSGVISLEAGAAIVIGSNLGTTITAILGAISGTPSKKRVAMSHFLFNFITTAAILPFIYPLMSVIVSVLNVKDPLIALVLFHSIFNLAGILLLSPFIGLLARFLETRFVSETTQVGTYINKVPVSVPEAAIEALRQEIISFIDFIFFLNIIGLNIRSSLLGRLKHPGKDDEHVSRSISHIENYATIKELEGKIIEYYVEIQNQKLVEEESTILNRYILSVRNGMISAKEVKDIMHNIREFENSSNDVKQDLYLSLKWKLTDFYLKLHRVFQSEKKEAHFEELIDLLSENQKISEWFLREVYNQVPHKSLNDSEISSLLHVNSGIHDANRSLILSIKDVLLTREEAENFNTIPQAK